jgi:hypothetical protein
MHENKNTVDTLGAMLDDLFTYHPPTEEQKAKYEAINEAAKNFARVVIENCPGSPDATAAVRLVREARMTANASIATKSGGLVRW